MEKILFDPRNVKKIGENKIYGDVLIYNTETKCFSAEISDLGFWGAPKELAVENIVTKETIKFKLVKTDTDGEDIFGWRYIAVSGNKKECRLLLIND